MQGISWQSVLFNLAVVNLSILTFGDFVGSMYSKKQAEKELRYSEDRLNQQNQQNSKNINSPEPI